MPATGCQSLPFLIITKTGVLRNSPRETKYSCFAPEALLKKTLPLPNAVEPGSTKSPFAGSGFTITLSTFHCRVAGSSLISLSSATPFVGSESCVKLPWPA